MAERHELKGGRDFMRPIDYRGADRPARRSAPAWGAFLVCTFVSYAVLALADTVDLEIQQGIATVIAKRYRPLIKTYEMQKTSKDIKWKPRLEKESFILVLNVAGKTTEFAVSRAEFDEIHQRDRIGVRYQLRRLTEEITVLAIVQR